MPPLLTFVVSVVQPGDDLQGAWCLGSQSSSTEGDRRTHHQRQVRSRFVT